MWRRRDSYGIVRKCNGVIVGRASPRCSTNPRNFWRNSRRGHDAANAIWRLVGALALACSVPARPSSPRRRRSSSTTPRSITTSSPPFPRKPRCSTRAPSSRDGRAPASRSTHGATPPTMPAAVPVCRFFGTPGRRSQLALLHGGRRRVRDGQGEPELDLRGDRVLHPSAAERRVRGAAPRPCTAASIRARASASRTTASCPTSRCTRRWPARSTLEGVVMCAPLSTAQKQADAVRLLEQATFGPTDALVAHVIAVGIERVPRRAVRGRGLALLEQQVRARRAARRSFCPTDPNPTCVRDYYSLFQLQNDFFRNALVNDDQLRQRVAFALSQIFVTSGLDINEAYGMATYQQIFLDNAFGNYEDADDQGDALLRDGRLPQHGQQRQARRRAPIPTRTTRASSCSSSRSALWELKLDGTLLLDANGQPIPTYDQDDGRGLRARVHRLDVSAPARARRSARTTRRISLGDMTAVRANHDTGAKSLLERRGRACRARDGRRPRQRDPQRVPQSEHRAVHRPAADPEARDRRSLAAVRRARGGRVQQQRRRACAAT